MRSDPVHANERGRSGSADRHHALDLLRGLAALAVSQYHFMTWNGVASVESMGTFAVYVFFVLSGLTMMMVYRGRFAQGVTPGQMRSFFRKRAARLLPLLAVVALLSAAKAAMTETIDLSAAILTGTGLMALHMPGFLSNSVGAWSLGIEMAFYAIFPIVAMLVTSWRQAALATIILLGAQHLLLWKIANSAPFWNYYVSNLIFAPFFALGLWISFDHRARASGYLPIAIIGLSAILCFSLLIPVDLMRDHASYLALTVGCGIVVWAAWRGVVPAILVPVATILGDVSYSLYLTHWIANDLVRILHLPLAIHWLLFTAIALIGSFLCFRLFENPMRAWLGTTRSSPDKRSAIPALP